MGKLTSEQASQLSNNFLGLAQAVGDYRFKNWNNLTYKENQHLASFQWSLLNHGEDILAFSTVLVLDEVEDTLKTIQTVTVKIQRIVGQLEDIQKMINIAAAAVILGAAIISKDTNAVTEGLKEFVKNAKPDESK